MYCHFATNQHPSIISKIPTHTLGEMVSSNTSHAAISPKIYAIEESG